MSSILLLYSHQWKPHTFSEQSPASIDRPSNQQMQDLGRDEKFLHTLLPGALGWRAHSCAQCFCTPCSMHSMLVLYTSMQLQYTERCVDAAGFKSQINTPVGKCMQRDENTAHCFLAVAMWAKGARAEIREQRARDSREERNPRDVCRRISVFLQPMYMITDDYCNSLAHLCVTFPAQWHKFCTMGERKKNLRTDQHLWQIHTAKHQKKSKKHLFVRYLCS